MAHTDDMIYITQSKFQEFVGQDARRICKSKERMICKNSSQPHGPTMKDCLMAKIAEASVAMNNLDFLPDDDVAKNWKEGKHGRHCGFSIYNKERNMIDFEAIGEISDASAALVGVSYYDHLVAAIDEFSRELVNVTFDSSRLRKEEVADHGYFVRHIAMKVSYLSNFL